MERCTKTTQAAAHDKLQCAKRGVRAMFENMKLQTEACQAQAALSSAAVATDMQLEYWNATLDQEEDKRHDLVWFCKGGFTQFSSVCTSTPGCNEVAELSEKRLTRKLADALDESGLVACTLGGDAPTGKLTVLAVSSKPLTALLRDRAVTARRYVVRVDAGQHNQKCAGGAVHSAPDAADDVCDSEDESALEPTFIVTTIDVDEIKFCASSNKARFDREIVVLTVANPVGCPVVHMHASRLVTAVLMGWFYETAPVACAGAAAEDEDALAARVAAYFNSSVSLGDTYKDFGTFERPGKADMLDFESEGPLRCALEERLDDTGLCVSTLCVAKGAANKRLYIVIVKSTSNRCESSGGHAQEITTIGDVLYLVVVDAGAARVRFANLCFAQHGGEAPHGALTQSSLREFEVELVSEGAYKISPPLGGVVSVSPNSDSTTELLTVFVELPTSDEGLQPIKIEWACALNSEYAKSTSNSDTNDDAAGDDYEYVIDDRGDPAVKVRVVDSPRGVTYRVNVVTDNNGRGVHVVVLGNPQDVGTYTMHIKAGTLQTETVKVSAKPEFVIHALGDESEQAEAYVRERVLNQTVSCFEPIESYDLRDVFGTELSTCTKITSQPPGVGVVIDPDDPKRVTICGYPTPLATSGNREKSEIQKPTPYTYNVVAKVHDQETSLTGKITVNPQYCELISHKLSKETQLQDAEIRTVDIEIRQTRLNQVYGDQADLCPKIYAHLKKQLKMSVTADPPAAGVTNGRALTTDINPEFFASDAEADAAIAAPTIETGALGGRTNTINLRLIVRPGVPDSNQIARCSIMGRIKVANVYTFKVWVKDMPDEVAPDGDKLSLIGTLRIAQYALGIVDETPPNVALYQKLPNPVLFSSKNVQAASLAVKKGNVRSTLKVAEVGQDSGGGGDKHFEVSGHLEPWYAADSYYLGSLNSEELWVEAVKNKGTVDIEYNVRPTNSTSVQAAAGIINVCAVYCDFVSPVFHYLDTDGTYAEKNLGDNSDEEAVGVSGPCTTDAYVEYKVVRIYKGVLNSLTDDLADAPLTKDKFVCGVTSKNGGRIDHVNPTYEPEELRFDAAFDAETDDASKLSKYYDKGQTPVYMGTLKVHFQLPAGADEIELSVFVKDQPYERLTKLVFSASGPVQLKVEPDELSVYVGESTPQTCTVIIPPYFQTADYQLRRPLDLLNYTEGSDTEDADVVNYADYIFECGTELGAGKVCMSVRATPTDPESPWELAMPIERAARVGIVVGGVLVAYAPITTRVHFDVCKFDESTAVFSVDETVLEKKTYDSTDVSVLEVLRTDAAHHVDLVVDAAPIVADRGIKFKSSDFVVNLRRCGESPKISADGSFTANEVDERTTDKLDVTWSERDGTRGIGTLSVKAQVTRPGVYEVSVRHSQKDKENVDRYKFAVIEIEDPLGDTECKELVIPYVDVYQVIAQPKYAVGKCALELDSYLVCLEGRDKQILKTLDVGYVAERGIVLSGHVGHISWYLSDATEPHRDFKVPMKVTFRDSVPNSREREVTRVFTVRISRPHLRVERALLEYVAYDNSGSPYFTKLDDKTWVWGADHDDIEVPTERREVVVNLPIFAVHQDMMKLGRYPRPTTSDIAEYVDVSLTGGKADSLTWIAREDAILDKRFEYKPHNQDLLLGVVKFTLRPAEYAVADTEVIKAKTHAVEVVWKNAGVWTQNDAGPNAVALNFADRLLSVDGRTIQFELNIKQTTPELDALVHVNDEADMRQVYEDMGWEYDVIKDAAVADVPHPTSNDKVTVQYVSADSEEEALEGVVANFALLYDTSGVTCAVLDSNDLAVRGCIRLKGNGGFKPLATYYYDEQKSGTTFAQDVRSDIASNTVDLTFKISPPRERPTLFSPRTVLQSVWLGLVDYKLEASVNGGSYRTVAREKFDVPRTTSANVTFRILVCALMPDAATDTLSKDRHSSFLKMLRDSNFHFETRHVDKTGDVVGATQSHNPGSTGSTVPITDFYIEERANSGQRGDLEVAYVHFKLDLHAANVLYEVDNVATEFYYGFDVQPMFAKARTNFTRPMLDTTIALLQHNSVVPLGAAGTEDKTMAYMNHKKTVQYHCGSDVADVRKLEENELEGWPFKFGIGTDTGSRRKDFERELYKCVKVVKYENNVLEIEYDFKPPAADMHRLTATSTGLQSVPSVDVWPEYPELLIPLRVSYKLHENAWGEDVVQIDLQLHTSYCKIHTSCAYAAFNGDDGGDTEILSLPPVDAPPLGQESFKLVTSGSNPVEIARGDTLVFQARAVFVNNDDDSDDDALVALIRNSIKVERVTEYAGTGDTKNADTSTVDWAEAPSIQVRKVNKGIFAHRPINDVGDKTRRVAADICVLINITNRYAYNKHQLQYVLYLKDQLSLGVSEHGEGHDLRNRVDVTFACTPRPYAPDRLLPHIGNKQTQSVTWGVVDYTGAKFNGDLLGRITGSRITLDDGPYAGGAKEGDEDFPPFLRSKLSEGGDVDVSTDTATTGTTGFMAKIKSLSLSQIVKVKGRHDGKHPIFKFYRAYYDPEATCTWKYSLEIMHRGEEDFVPATKAEGSFLFRANAVKFTNARACIYHPNKPINFTAGTPCGLGNCCSVWTNTLGLARLPETASAGRVNVKIMFDVMPIHAVSAVPSWAKSEYVVQMFIMLREQAEDLKTHLSGNDFKGEDDETVHETIWGKFTNTDEWPIVEEQSASVQPDSSSGVVTVTLTGKLGTPVYEKIRKSTTTYKDGDVVVVYRAFNIFQPAVTIGMLSLPNEAGTAAAPAAAPAAES